MVKMEAGQAGEEDDDWDDDDDDIALEDAMDLEGVLVDVLRASNPQSPQQSFRQAGSAPIPMASSPPLMAASSPPSIPSPGALSPMASRKAEAPAAQPVIGDEILALTVHLSLCAQQVGALTELDEQKLAPLFDANRVSFEQVASNPAILFDQNLMARLNGKYYGGTAAIALISSMVIFRKKFEIPSVISAPSSGQAQKAAEKRGWGWRLWPFPARAPPQSQPPGIAARPLSPVIQATLQPAEPVQPLQKLAAPAATTTPLMRKSVRPTHEQLEQLNLQPGMNSIVFSVQSGAAVREVRSSLYLLDEGARIVISDIDGTITRSDALGHIFTAIGRDWSQSGVAQLFTAIRANGYHIMYLTARCIGVARSTRKFIQSVKQKDIGSAALAEQHTLPPGPVFMSPMRLLSALNKEVVHRTPEEFKIACLTDILGLFPAGSRPFYAGFGNRRSDVDSYRFVGINEDKIFTINHKGYIRTRNRTYRKTYTSLHELVDDMFPPFDSASGDLDEQFNDANYWALPLPELPELA
jgi:phosphatidate phosphatase LPIN